MAQSVAAIPLVGLIPNDPTLTPGLELALTPAQRRRLDTALRQAPSPALVLSALQQALQKGEPLLRILERLRNNNQAAVIRPYAIRPPEREVSAPRTAPRPSARPTHRPSNR